MAAKMQVRFDTTKQARLQAAMQSMAMNGKELHDITREAAREFAFAAMGYTRVTKGIRKAMRRNPLTGHTAPAGQVYVMTNPALGRRNGKAIKTGPARIMSMPIAEARKYALRRSRQTRNIRHQAIDEQGKSKIYGKGFIKSGWKGVLRRMGIAAPGEEISGQIAMAQKKTDLKELTGAGLSVTEIANQIPGIEKLERKGNIGARAMTAVERKMTQLARKWAHRMQQAWQA